MYIVAFIYLTKADHMPKDRDRQGSDESTFRAEITQAMIVGGVIAYSEWKENRKVDPDLSTADLVSSIYVHMRRACRHGGHQ
jgi:hypothetical protein